jgi:hypothetical protein
MRNNKYQNFGTVPKYTTKIKTAKIRGKMIKSP